MVGTKLQFLDNYYIEDIFMNLLQSLYFPVQIFLCISFVFLIYHWIDKLFLYSGHKSLKYTYSLGSVAQLIGALSLKQKVTGSIPSWGKYIDCQFSPGWGVYKRQLIDVFLSYQCFYPLLSPSFPFSLEIHKHALWWG